MTAIPEPIPFKSEGPQPLLRETKAGHPYPVGSLGPLQQAVEAVQGVTQAPMAIAAQSALAVASLAVQGFANVETLSSARPLSLYALTIARSGERKSTCDGFLMQGLHEFEREESERHREEQKIWLTRHALWKVQHDAIMAGLKKTGKGGKTQVGAEADLAALGDEPPAPPSLDRTATEPTYEGLTRKFAEGQPSLGIFSDEGGQFLGGFAMSSDHRQKTLAALNKLWDASAPLDRTRQGDGSIKLYGRRLAIHLMVQPGVARDFMADPKADDTGFMARFLVCEPTSTIGTRLHALSRTDNAPIHAFARRLRAVLDTPMPMDQVTRALEPRTLPLTDDARKMLIGFADAIEAQQAVGGELCNVTGTASKAAEQACRIAGVLTLWRDLNAPAVTTDDMVNGIDLAQFYLSEALRLADAAKISAETERAERLRRWLIEDWPHQEVLTGDVVQKAPIRALRETGAANATMAVLEKHGWVIPLEAGTVVRGAARKTAWRIVKVITDVV